MPVNHGVRNEEICRLYTTGSTLEECGAPFGLTRERVRQILRQYRVYKSDRPVEVSTNKRDTFLGVNVTSTTKAALKTEAKERSISVSALVDEKLGGDDAK